MGPLMEFLFIMLVVFQVKHFIADYPLQFEWMLGKFKKDWSFFLPLVAHCGVHAYLTFWIIFFFDFEQRDKWIVALIGAIFDFTIHFFMDRIKAGPKYLGRFKPLTASEFKEAKSWLLKGSFSRREARKRLLGNKLFWWSLGFDQMVHHLTDYVIIFLMLFDKGLWLI